GARPVGAAGLAITWGVGITKAMASAINMLGDVHGGAGEQCVRFYHAIAARMDDGRLPLAEAVAAEMAALAGQGTRHVPGFGHRFHPRHPRAPPLLQLVDAAAAA